MVTNKNVFSLLSYHNLDSSVYRSFAKLGFFYFSKSFYNYHFILAATGDDMFDYLARTSNIERSDAVEEYFKASGRVADLNFYVIYNLKVWLLTFFDELIFIPTRLDRLYDFKRLIKDGNYSSFYDVQMSSLSLFNILMEYTYLNSSELAPIVESIYSNEDSSDFLPMEIQEERDNELIYKLYPYIFFYSELADKYLYNWSGAG